MNYRVNEIFYSLQGEGARAGEASLFLRFSGCNLSCAMEPGPRSPGGFVCDTDFQKGVDMTEQEILIALRAKLGGARPTYVVMTGGEPGLQVSPSLIRALHMNGYRVAIETNGTKELPDRIDWITCSPKLENRIVIKRADELKYIMAAGQPLPSPRIHFRHKFLSPRFEGTEIDRGALAWCISLVQNHPEWRLSVQQHKEWGIR